MADRKDYMSDVELHRRYNVLKKRKSERTELMRQINDYFTPPDEKINASKQVGKGLFKCELLDTTGTDLIDEYVAFVLGIQYASGTRWFTCKHTKSDGQSDINRILAARADELLVLLRNSPYYSALGVVERDTILQGHSGLVIESSEKNFIECSTIDSGSLYLQQNKNAEVQYAFFVEKFAAFEILDMFPSLNFRLRAKDFLMREYEKEFNLVSFYAPMRSPFYTGIPEEDTPKFFKKYFLDTDSITENERLELYIDEIEFFDDENIFFTRDAYGRNFPYGQGVGKKALPKSRITNKLMYNLLKMTGLQANPPRVQHTMITAEGGHKESLQEGQVFTLTPTDLDGMDPAKAISLLQVSGGLNELITLFQLQQSQLAQLLPSASNIYKVARQSIAEIQQRFAELERRLAPLRTTFLREGPVKHLRLLYKIAENQGRFNTEKLKLPGAVKLKDLRFDIDPSLTQTFKQGKALRAAQALGLVANFLNFDPSGALLFNIDKIIETGFDGYNVLDLLDSRENVQKKREIQKQQVERQQQQEAMQANLAADASNSKILLDLLGRETE